MEAVRSKDLRRFGVAGIGAVEFGELSCKRFEVEQLWVREFLE